MNSTAQIAANQQNAQFSTRPRTEEGKSVSSQNGISSAFRVLIHENQSELDALKLALETEFHPQGEHEGFLVSQMVQSRWRLNRINRLETVAYDFILLGEDLTNSTDPDAKIVTAMSKGDRDPLTLLERYRTTAERAYYKAHRELTANRRNAKKEAEQVTEQIIRQTLYCPTPGQLEKLQNAVDGFVSAKYGDTTQAPLRL